MEGADRHYDVVVVGGSSAGLSAALVLGRSRRRTMVLDTDEPRNTPSSGVQSFFSRDGILPKELLRIGREQLTPYPSVELRSARATGARVEDGGFEVSLDDGSNVRARKLLLATGVTDELPEKPGFEQFWGRASTTAPTAMVGRSGTDHSRCSLGARTLWREHPASATGAAMSWSAPTALSD